MNRRGTEDTEEDFVMEGRRKRCQK